MGTPVIALVKCTEVELTGR
ncbi:hypothetical protein ACK8N7_34665 [Streptomyces griseobrunneus]